MPGKSTNTRAVRRRTQSERSAETRYKLIHAAIDVICQRGYANLTTLEVAARAGVSRGALQHQFHTRYDLLAAVGDQLTGDMLALSADLTTASLPLAARIDAAVNHYWTVYTGKTFLAILDISLGVKHDSRLLRPIRRHFENVYRASDKPWLMLLGDTGASRVRLIALRRIVLATLRGLAVARFIGILGKDNKAELGLLKTMLIEQLGAHRDGQPGTA